MASPGINPFYIKCDRKVCTFLVAQNAHRIYFITSIKWQ